jgi:hypothetical protein
MMTASNISSSISNLIAGRCRSIDPRHLVQYAYLIACIVVATTCLYQAATEGLSNQWNTPEPGLLAATNISPDREVVEPILMRRFVATHPMMEMDFGEMHSDDFRKSPQRKGQQRSSTPAEAKHGYKQPPTKAVTAVEDTKQHDSMRKTPVAASTPYATHAIQEASKHLNDYQKVSQSYSQNRAKGEQLNSIKVKTKPTKGRLTTEKTMNNFATIKNGLALKLHEHQANKAMERVIKVARRDQIWHVVMKRRQQE